MIIKVKIDSWDPVFNEEYVNYNYDNKMLPFDTQPSLTVEYSEDLEKYIRNNSKGRFTIVMVSGSICYDGVKIATIYTNDVDYKITLREPWLGYPDKNGFLILEI
jgi:hypothetical protein